MKQKCALCKKEFEGFGNNPYGVLYSVDENYITEPKLKENDVCCDRCNTAVIYGRIYRRTFTKEEFENAKVYEDDEMIMYSVKTLIDNHNKLVEEYNKNGNKK